MINQQKPSFLVRYFKDDGIFFITSNRRLTRFQSAAKKFASYKEACAFCPFDISAGLADVVQPYEFGV